MQSFQMATMGFFLVLILSGIATSFNLPTDQVAYQAHLPRLFALLPDDADLVNGNGFRRSARRHATPISDQDQQLKDRFARGADAKQQQEGANLAEFAFAKRMGKFAKRSPWSDDKEAGGQFAAPMVELIEMVPSVKEFAKRDKMNV